MSCQDCRNEACICTEPCRRHGNCRACVAHHRDVASLPACLRFLLPKTEPEQDKA